MCLHVKNQCELMHQLLDGEPHASVRYLKLYLKHVPGDVGGVWSIEIGFGNFVIILVIPFIASMHILNMNA